MQCLSNRDIFTFVTLLISLYIASVSQQVSPVEPSSIVKLAASCFTTIKDYAIINARLTTNLRSSFETNMISDQIYNKNEKN